MSLTFPTTYETVPDGFRAEACFTLDYSRDRMRHAVGQLTDEQLWWRPTTQMNAVGNIVPHVCGNMRQWIVTNLRGEPDDRDRPAEFARREPVAGAELTDRLRRTVDDARAAIMASTDAELLRVRHVQIADVTGLGAVLHSVSHLEGHAQEVIYITRLQLGDAYRFRNVY